MGLQDGKEKMPKKRAKKIPWVTMSCGMNGGSEGGAGVKSLKLLKKL